jgi:hypothetical protein
MPCELGSLDRDLAQGYGKVYLPFALTRKYPNAEKQWIWQYVFPGNRLFKAIASSNFNSSEQLFWVTSVQKIEKIYPLV